MSNRDQNKSSRNFHHPPEGWLRLLRVICPEHLYEEIEGDLTQKFNKDVKKFGATRANRRLGWNAIRFVRPGILLRHSPSINLTSMYMLTNYFKVALRVMVRNKTYAVINIAGLAFGITGAMLLSLWITKEFSYDQFHSDKERIYEAWNKRKTDGRSDCWNITPRVLAPTLVQEYANIEMAISYAKYADTYLFSVGENRIMRDNVQFADPEFLRIFSFPLVKGNAASAMTDPNTIVLTERFAKQLFGEREAFGETLTISLSGQNFPLIVTGILKDLPSNTDFDFEFLIPWQFVESLSGKETNWHNNSVRTFVKINEGTDVENLNREIKDVRKTHAADTDDTEVFLYAFTKNHLYARFENGVPVGGRIEIIRMLGILGVCLVAIGCINFINLSTARAQRRSKEVAVRKVSGAYRRSLVMQFLCESVLITLGAALISLLAVYFLLPSFSTLVQEQVSLNFQNLAFWAGMLAVSIIVGLIAGSYPALYLSSLRPVAILKGGRISTSSKNAMRTALVVFQFGFAITMIVSTMVVHKQIKYVQNRETGYAKDNLVYHALVGDLDKNYTAYRNELLQSGVAVSVTKTSSPITQRMSNTTGIQWKGKDPQNSISIERFNVDENISATAGLTIIEGRDMDLQRFPSDSAAVILNETAVKLMGFDRPVGEVIVDDGQAYHVVGVIKDFILTSPYQKVEPMVLLGGKKKWVFNVVHISLNPDRTTQKNIAGLSNLFKKYNPDYPFEYNFANVAYAQKFSDMKTTRTITTLFTSISIFIACLGLLGLSTYMTEARIKEIGIRKVLGGSVISIIKLLSVTSLKPILMAIALFSPLAWFAMSWWLNFYAYRVSLSIWIFAAAGASIIVIAMVTIAIQTFGAANTNPVKTLRTE